MRSSVAPEGDRQGGADAHVSPTGCCDPRSSRRATASAAAERHLMVEGVAILGRPGGRPPGGRCGSTARPRRRQRLRLRVSVAIFGRPGRATASPATLAGPPHRLGVALLDRTEGRPPGWTETRDTLEYLCCDPRSPRTALRNTPQRGALSGFQKSGEQLALLAGEDPRIAAVRARLARFRVGEQPVLDPGGHHPGAGLHLQSESIGDQIRRRPLDPGGEPISVHGTELTSRFERRELCSPDVTHKAWGSRNCAPHRIPARNKRCGGSRLIP